MSRPSWPPIRWVSAHNSCSQSVQRASSYNVAVALYPTAQGADLVAITDMGSTDGTPEALRALGAAVHSVSIRPFRFDTARNTALNLLPPDCDLCLSLDLDERLQPGWLEVLREAWASPQGFPTTVFYDYVYSFNPDGTPSLRFMQNKFHARWNYTWRHPCHEMPYWTGAPGEEHVAVLPQLRLHHRQDRTKSRASYLPLLKLGVEEDPDNPRRAYYYGRELMYEQLHEAAVAELERYLALPEARWAAERASALRFIAQCQLALGRPAEAQQAAHRAVLEEGDQREGWLQLAKASGECGDWSTASWAATKALAITERRPSSFADDAAWGWGAYDVAALAAHYAGIQHAAVRYGEAALALNPGDARLRTNLRFYREALQREQAARLPRVTPTALPGAQHLRVTRRAGPCALGCQPPLLPCLLLPICRCGTKRNAAHPSHPAPRWVFAGRELPGAMHALQQSLCQHSCNLALAAGTSTPLQCFCLVVRSLRACVAMLLLFCAPSGTTGADWSTSRRAGATCSGTRRRWTH